MGTTNKYNANSILGTITKILIVIAVVAVLIAVISSLLVFYVWIL